MSVSSDFKDIFANQQQLAVMPISRLLVESRIDIGKFKIYPPNELDIDELRPIPNDTLENGSNLREVCSSLTGITLDILRSHPLIAFPVEIPWDDFLQFDHGKDIALLRRLNQDAERAIDLIRLYFCRFDLPDTLPGRVGSWSDSGQHIAALLYNPADHESYLIAGPGVTTAIVRGIGLDLDFWPQRDFPTGGEVGSIALHGLSLFRDTLEASNETHRFTRAMTLLEFLASPDSYRQMKEVKKEIAVHVANNAASYSRVLDRFRELSSKKDASGQEFGLRTRLVHHGRYIEDILPKDKDRVDVFRELQSYAHAVLEDMLDNSQLSWDEFLEFRRTKRQKIGVSPEA